MTSALRNEIEEIREALDELYDTYSCFRDFCSSNGDSSFWYSWEDQVNYSCNDFHLRSGASRGVVIFDNYDYVVKFDFEEEAENGYNLREANIYNIAKKNSMSKFFAKSFHAGTFHGLDIYLMEKANVDEDAISSCVWNSRMYDENMDKVPDEVGLAMSLDDVKTVVNFFGEFYQIDWVMRLLTFCEEYDIFDIHENNVGFINNMPVLIDYAGFN